VGKSGQREIGRGSGVEGSEVAAEPPWRVLDNSDRQCTFLAVKLSNKGRYAVRALFDIAFYNDGKPTQVKDIAERQDIPPRFLEQIFQDLKRAGLVGSKRGPSGGYNLQVPASQIRVGDILRVTEGPVSLSETTDASDASVAGANGRRQYVSARDVTEHVFCDLSSRIEACLDGVCLQDMCDQAEKAGLRRPRAARYHYVI
jgi:Rrf2 family iron-sulfur cluster assembly transcriptional regulator